LVTWRAVLIDHTATHTATHTIGKVEGCAYRPQGSTKEYRALLIEFGALLIEFGALLTESRALVIEYRALLNRI